MTRRQTWVARVLAIATLTLLASLLVSQSQADASPRQLLPPLPTTVTLTVPDLTTLPIVPDVTLLPTTLPTILPPISVPTTLPQILPTTSTAAPTTAPTTASTVAGAPPVTTAPGAPAPPAGAPAPTVAGGPTTGSRGATDAPIGDTEEAPNAIPPGANAPDRLDEDDVGETADEVMIDPATGLDLAAARPPSETPTPIERITGFAFPIGLALLIAGFLLVQHRLDADDPKLAPSPARNPDAMPLRDGSV